MDIQLSLPAGWARNSVSYPDPRERLDALNQAKLDVKVAIRTHLDGLADRLGLKTREVDRAMESIDDTISNLVYEVEAELQDEIDELIDDE